MYSTSHVPVTPQRKRSASSTLLGSHDVPATPIGFPESLNTPGIRSVPDLDWDDTPQSTAHSPRTPSSITTPSKVLPTDKEVHGIPSRPVKELRRSNRLKARAALQSMPHDPTKTLSSKLGCSDLKPALLFPLSLYPAKTAIKIEYTAMSDLVKGDIAKKNFKFHELSRALHNSEYVEAITPTPRYALRSARETERKRVKETASKVEDIARYMTTTAAVSQTVPFKTEGIPRNCPIRSKDTKLALDGVTGKRFSRILPLDAIDRLMEDPKSCVASLISRPDERCSRVCSSPGDVKSWLATKLSELEDPFDIITSESYIREFVNMMTCSAYHRKIATDQLERLLDRCHNRRDRHTGSKHDFTKSDIKAVRRWLEALTKPPGRSSNQSTQPLQQKAASPNTSEPVITRRSQLGSKLVCDEISPDVDPNHLSSEDVEVVQRTTDAFVLQTCETRNTLQAGHDSIELSQTRQLFEITKTVEVTQTVSDIETSEKDQSIGATRTIETFRATETTQDTGAAPPFGEDNENGEKSETIVVKKTIDAISTIETMTEPTKVTQHVKTTRTFTTKQRVETLSMFRPPPIDEISFIAAQTNTAAARRSLRAGARPIKVDVEELQTLSRIFIWYKMGINFSVEEWIHKWLFKPLTSREYAPPEKPPNGTLRYPGQGLIYMYWEVGQFGFVKIGKTSGESTEKRLNEWERDCGHEIEEHTRGEKGVALQLPHVFRVESLVHAELKDFRIKEERCERCRKGHVEWFAVSPSHAQKVIKKWSDWMLSRPYTKTNGNWQLKDTISVDEINTLCTPIEMPVQHRAVLPMLQRHIQPETTAKRAKGRKKSR